MKGTISGTMLTLLVIGALSLTFNIRAVKAEEIIYIRSNGTVDPSTAPIQRVGDVYTLTEDVYNKSIEVQRSNVILDGNNHRLQGPRSVRNVFGIHLQLRENVTITNFVISGGFIYGILLDSSSYNKVINNTILGCCTCGVELSWSNHNLLKNNTVMKTYEAISLEYSSYNNLHSNVVRENTCGIKLSGGTMNTLRDNVMAANRYNFFVGFFWLTNYIHDIDTSNIVDGKPIYYWINRFNETVPLDAGCVVIVNSSRIVVENLKLQNNECGVIFAYTRNSLIENVTATGNSAGILLENSDCNIITKNNLTANNGPGIALVLSNYNNVTYNIVLNSNASGIWLEDTNYNTVIGNNVAYSRPGGPQEFDGAGILVDDSRHCKVIGNNVTRNTYGIVVGATPSVNNLVVGNNIVMNNVGLILFDAKSNRIYHNNFIANELQQVQTYFNTRGSTFDCGYPSGGNYWSDYTGVDLYCGPYQNETGSDGIGDTPYVIDENNVDRYPLMNPWKLVTISCDVNHDGKVDIIDVVLAASIYGCREGEPNWNPEADITSPYGIIDILDLVTIAYHYGRTCP